LDSWTDGEGGRSINSGCNKTLARYARFQELIRHHLTDFEEKEPIAWAEFMGALHRTSLSELEHTYYSPVELNELCILENVE
jgi:hypothetical protein